MVHVEELVTVQLAIQVDEVHVQQHDVVLLANQAQ